MTETCRYCEQLIVGEAHVQCFGYWYGYKFWSHAARKTAGFKQEAYECQKIDGDCNDCAYFERDRMLSKGIWIGRCKNPERRPGVFARLTGETVRAYPMFCSDHPCFVHRKDL